MEPKWTKAPWTVETCWSQETGAAFYLKEQQGNEDSAEAQANASLIAAAPDLYEALRAIISDLPAKRDWLDPNSERYARIILAKARGEK